MCCPPAVPADQGGPDRKTRTATGASVIQAPLGTIDVNATARAAIDSPVDYRVPVVASAADEEAEQHNLPAVLLHTFAVNSTTQDPVEADSTSSLQNDGQQACRCSSWRATST